MPIADIGLPGLYGIELITQIKAAQAPENAPQTKIIILTLQDEKAAILAAFAAGANSYCMKNIRTVLLTHKGNSGCNSTGQR